MKVFVFVFSRREGEGGDCMEGEVRNGGWHQHGVSVWMGVWTQRGFNALALIYTHTNRHDSLFDDGHQLLNRPDMPTRMPTTLTHDPNP